MSTASVREIQSGDRVDIVAGPFAGGRAVVKTLDIGAGKVHVEMLVLGDPAPFTVGLNQVRLAEVGG